MDEDEYVNILKNKLSTSTNTRKIYFGKIVNKKNEQRMNLNTLNSVLFSVMPSLYKFKIFNDEIYYAQAINKLSNLQPKKYKERVCIGYSGINEVYREGNIKLENLRFSNLPVNSLYIYHPKKNYDVLIECSTVRNEAVGDMEFLEELDKEILEFEFNDADICCYKIKNLSNCTKYEVNVLLKPSIEFNDILNLIHNMFDDIYVNKRY